MQKTNKKEAVKLIAELQQVMSLERIAVELGKSYGTIWRWKSDYLDDAPDIANLQALRRLSNMTGEKT